MVAESTQSTEAAAVDRLAVRLSNAHCEVETAINWNAGASLKVEFTVMVLNVVPQRTRAVEPKLKFASSEVVWLSSSTYLVCR